eukprot:TRINITY_DN67605_c5_g3_i1.p1 TRINITY_DN67605_c5_g3~~TRINITY_DN67605_c5_g3_i1.p1  ORF type:complete len:1118 (+),score=723.53 TRINITY_DN67605_c5_g3_i1:28-3354(+)
MRAREALKKKLREQSAAAVGVVVEEEEETGLEAKVQSVPSQLAPAHVAYLDDAEVSHISCYGDHSLAVSHRSGTVYAWGYGNNGRLGLGEEDGGGERSEQEPNVLTTFAHKKKASSIMAELEEAPLMEEEAGGGPVEEEEDDDGDDDGGGDDDLTDEEKEMQEVDVMADVKKQLAKNKERFAVMQMAQKLINRKREEYVHAMDDYLLHMDEKESSQDIVNLAIQARIAENKAKDENRPVPEFDPQDPELLRDESQLPLNELEEIVARFYLAPALMHRLYEDVSKTLAEESTEAGTPEQLRATFADFVFSVWDMHRQSDRHLFELFYERMMRTHIHSANEMDNILAADSLEYEVFRRIFDHGKLRRRIRNILAKPLSELDRTPPLVGKEAEEYKAPSVRMMEEGNSGDQPTVEEPVEILLEHTQELLRDLTSTSVVALMDNIEWLVRITDQSFKDMRRKEKGIIGRRLVRVLADVALADQQQRREMLDKKKADLDALNPHRQDRARQLDEDAELFVLHALRGSEELIKFIYDHFNIEPHHLPSRVRRFWREPEILKCTRAYVNHIKIKEEREAKANKEGNMGAVVTYQEERERAILHNFLLSRTIFERRVVRISPHVVRLLGFYQYYSGDLPTGPMSVMSGMSEDDYMSDRGGSSSDLLSGRRGSDAFGGGGGGRRLGGVDEHGRSLVNPTNLRLDTFHLPANRLPVVNNGGCSWTSPLDDLPDEEIDLAGLTNESGEYKRMIRLEQSECVALWKVLKLATFQEIVRRKAGEGAWKDIMRTLKVKRQEAVERRNYELSERYETATRQLRRIKDARQGTVVFLGNEKTPSIRTEMVDPARLFARLRAIDEKSESSQKNAVRNVELFASVVKALDHTAALEEEASGEVREVFNYLTGLAKDNKLDSFKAEWKDSGTKSKVRTYKKIEVYKDKGAMKRYTHQELFMMGVLEEDPDRRNRVKKPMCFSIDSCLFLHSTEHERNMHKFVAVLSFVFITTHDPDIFEVKVVFGSENLLTSAMLSLAQLRSGVAHSTIGEDKGVFPDCHILRYDPQGARVFIKREQTFQFNREALADMLDRLPRLHPRGGEQVAIDRGTEVINVVGVDDSQLQSTD